MTLAKPTFPCARPRSRPLHRGTRWTHAEQVWRAAGAENSPRSGVQVLQALLSSHRPLGAYEVIDELAPSRCPRPAPITVYRRARFPDGKRALVHRIEKPQRLPPPAAHDHDETSMVRVSLICRSLRARWARFSAGAGVAQSLLTPPGRRADRLRAKLSVVEIAGTCAHCQKI